MNTREPNNGSPNGEGAFYVDPPGVRAAAAHLDKAEDLLRQIGIKLVGLNSTSPGYDAVSLAAGQDVQAAVEGLQVAVNSAEQRANNLANSVRLFVASYEQTDQDVLWPQQGRDA